ncbi:formate dehydrogenase accessory sulfurtransferase FdhD [Luteimonas aestuarii]|uniref:Sulfur carrier protein FdhD n=1 Tax=Luteimonas aestuarii TaxID=453837 RepID=A0A4V3AM12_9GAMM|nr:formate dehydrogenase accessory sulfurtransferase FdhD [Luteimonas aestuarii]TDK25149.1 formate dehydrogenase accessory sulfurtransferase FdhD [Luteimonas aestuarii]
MRLRGDAAAREADWIAEEIPVAFAFNGEPFAVMMATPADIADFAVGFALSEGIVETANELQIEAIDTTVDGIAVSLRVPAARMAAMSERKRNIEGRSGCGICGAASIDAVLRPPRRVSGGIAIASGSLAAALIELERRQPLNALTGATHAAAWADAEGRLLLVREDVGRHNALDKLIGAMQAADIDAGSGFCVVTSRASYEMAMKAAQSGMPMLAAISAPTALAIALADSAGMTLVGFARGDGCVAYAHPHRLHASPLAESSP